MAWDRESCMDTTSVKKSKKDDVGDRKIKNMIYISLLVYEILKMKY